MESATSSRRVNHEQRRRRRFVLRDRRSGFDRRRAHRRGSLGAAFEDVLIYLRDHPASLAIMLVLANLLSLVDLVLTLTLLRLGVIEANPVMRYLFASGATQAAVVKSGVIVVASLVIWQLRRRRPALTAALLIVSLYGAVVAYEAVGLAHLL
jgi:Domain of unknown function (DUF5658)